MSNNRWSDSSDQSKRLRWLKRHLALSQRDMAAKLDISRPHLAEVLRGKYEISTGLARALVGQWPDLNLDWLLTGRGKPFVTPSLQDGVPPKRILYCSGLDVVLQPKDKAEADPLNHHVWVPGHMLDNTNEYRVASPRDDALEPRIPTNSTILLKKGDFTAEEADTRFGLVKAPKETQSGRTSVWALRHCLLSDHDGEEKLYILPVQKPWKYRPLVYEKENADGKVKAILVAAWLNYGELPPRCEDFYQDG